LKSLYVMGTAGSGKTAMCVGLALKLQESGFKVAYFKPVAVMPHASGKPDEDIVLMRDLLSMDISPEEMVVLTSGPFYLSRYERSETYLSAVKKAFEAATKDADVALIGGAPWPHSLSSLGMDSISLARELGARALIVNKVDNDYSLDNIIMYNELARARGVEVLGNVLNNVPRALLDKSKGVYKPCLEDRGYEVLGIVPKRIEVAAPTVQEFCDVLGGEVLTGEDRMDLLVEDVLVGAMTMDSALSYLRRTTNKAIITGGDRADLALAALETSTSVLILTGGLYPTVNVITRATEKGVPVILVHYDTFTTIEKLHEVSRKIKPGDEKSIAMVKENVEKYCRWEDILSRLC